MSKLFCSFLLLFVSLGACLAEGVQSDTAVHILPEPVSLTVEPGHFQLLATTAVVAADAELAGVAQMLVERLNRPTGYQLSVQRKSNRQHNAIVLALNKKRDTALGDEGYTLKATSEGVRIAGNTPHGVFYGMQTLMQLFDPAIENNELVKGHRWEIPAVRITDYPRFRWRGLMRDVSRHFFSKESIMAYIDEMAKYKFNRFHWHLSDDHGWRIEIKGLPKLTEVGAWRVKRTGRFDRFKPAQPGEKATDGGYYTQEDIREVVAYAQKHFITVLPEIDVPGHCLALIASYPNLSCTKLQYHVNAGWSFYRKDDNALCVANDSTWMILDKIFTQVAALFPGKYIDVGGDEAYKGFWEKCPEDQALMKKQGITDVNDLQDYFEKKLEKLIQSKGKQMMGWDEILDAGLDKGTAVMSWRGMKHGVEASKNGHYVVMSPTKYCYLDLYQGDPLIEPATYSRLRLSTTYQFDPIAPGADPKYILGGQGNLWAEGIPNERQAQYMTWPRGLALAEVLWSPKNKQNWVDFIARMEDRFAYLDAAEVKYSRAAFDPIIAGVKDDKDSLQVKLYTEIPGLEIYYRFDGTNPDKFSPRYTGTPLNIPNGAIEIRVITYRDGKPVGRQINCPIDAVSKRLNY